MIKKSDFKECFLVICTTYLCNTFVQFSGLGYRAYYIKKNKNIDINKFILLSLFIILIKLLVFSLISIILLFFLILLIIIFKFSLLFIYF